MQTLVWWSASLSHKWEVMSSKAKRFLQTQTWTVKKGLCDAARCHKLIISAALAMRGFAIYIFKLRIWFGFGHLLVKVFVLLS